MKALASASREAIDPLISLVIDPALKAQLIAASFALKVPYAFFKELLPDEADEFLKEALLAPNLTKTLFESSEFQQALGNTLQNLIYAKEKTKRDLIKKVFLEAYINQQEYAKNHLERLQGIAQQISLPGLEHLFFLKKQVIPLRDKELDNTLKIQSPPSGFTQDEFRHLKLRTVAISTFYDAWHSLQRVPNSPPRPDERMLDAIEDKKRNEFSEIWSELDSLAIFKQGSDPTVGEVRRVTGTIQYLTDFGEKFLSYLPTIT